MVADLSHKCLQLYTKSYPQTEKSEYGDQFGHVQFRTEITYACMVQCLH